MERWMKIHFFWCHRNHSLLSFLMVTLFWGISLFLSPNIIKKVEILLFLTSPEVILFSHHEDDLMCCFLSVNLICLKISYIMKEKTTSLEVNPAGDTFGCEYERKSFFFVLTSNQSTVDFTWDHPMWTQQTHSRKGDFTPPPQFHWLFSMKKGNRLLGRIMWRRLFWVTVSEPDMIVKKLKNSSD